MEIDGLLIAFGCLLLAGLGLDALGRRTRLPRITLLVLFGLVVGPAGVDLLPIGTDGWYETVAKVALTMIAFLLGGELSKRALQAHGRAILAVSLCVMIATLLFIAGGLLFIGVPVALALLLAGIGTATAPASTHDVVKEVGTEGPFTRTVLGVVAIDDAWGIIAFSVILGFLAGAGTQGLAAGLTNGLVDVLGAVVVGLVVGLPGAYATGRVQSGQPTLAEALGIVLLCAGLSLYFEVSFLLAGMTAGAVIVNLARHHDYPFHEIEYISWPFLILFFVLAGATVDVEAIFDGGVVVIAFIVLRLAGRLLGGWMGGRLGGMPDRQGWLMGIALTPQAGVALGMALVASEAAPDIAPMLLTITVGTTIFFELVGPILTRFALRRAAEAEQSGSG